MTTTYFQKFFSPVGELYIYASSNELLAITMSTNRAQVLKQIGIAEVIEKSNAVLRVTILQLKKYFKGELKNFNVPVKLIGTKFQTANWAALQKIPFGKVRSYSEQARILKNKSAVRAVGAANSRNPILIVIPCHRLVGSRGHLTGYTGGLSAKAKLLAIEGSEEI